jgi:hypothetical protein
MLYLALVGLAILLFMLILIYITRGTKTERDKIITALVKADCILTWFNGESLNEWSTERLKAHLHEHESDSGSGEWPEDP